MKSTPKNPKKPSVSTEVQVAIARAKRDHEEAEQLQKQRRDRSLKVRTAQRCLRELGEPHIDATLKNVAAGQPAPTYTRLVQHFIEKMKTASTAVSELMTVEEFTDVTPTYSRTDHEVAKGLFLQILRGDDPQQVRRDLLELLREFGEGTLTMLEFFEDAATRMTSSGEPIHTTKKVGQPVLSEEQQVFRDIFLSRKPEDALTGPSACEDFTTKTGKGIDEGDFRRRIVPALKEWGLENKRKVGYYFPVGSLARRMSRG